MNIYIVRHGDAEGISITQKDFDRKLTARGISSVEAAAKGWIKLTGRPDFIISSPLIRAVETAKIIAGEMGIEDKFRIDNRLAPGCITQALIDIADEIECDDIMFVGHEPDCSQHVSALTSSSGVNVEFRKAMIAKISFGNRIRFGKGSLDWILPASLFDTKKG